MNSVLNFRETIFNIIIIIPGILIAFTFHEYAHALVADMLGDKTPRFQGRLTLNPVAHIDPIGFILTIIFKFGWAKPVQTNPSAYKNYHKDDLKVSLAGPIANFLVAIIVSIIVGIYNKFGYIILPSTVAWVIGLMLGQTIRYNIYIGIFNLIPVPPLDGFSILRNLKPKVFYEFQEKFYRYQFLIMLALLYFGGIIISIPAEFLIGLLGRLISLVTNFI